jgi:G3E family GTPase
MRAPVTTTLVTGPSAGAREQAIHAQLQLSDMRHAVIIEGIASGTSPLDSLPEHILFARIAPGCLCCAGNLVLRVTLNRLLRQRPDRLFIGVANGEHLDQLRSWLQAEPYDQLLRLTPDLVS